MAKIVVPSDGSPILMVPALGKGIVRVERGTVRIGIEADPTAAGITMNEGEVLAITDWASAWNAATAIPGRDAILFVEEE